MDASQIAPTGSEKNLVSKNRAEAAASPHPTIPHNPALSIAFTELALVDPYLGGKHFHLTDNGVEKETVGYIHEATARVVQVNGIKGLRDYLATHEPGRKVLAYGLPKSEVPETGLRVLSAKRSQQEHDQDAIQRNRDNFEYADGPGVFFLDHDANDEVFDGRVLFGHLKDAATALGDVQFVWSASSSSHICNGDREVYGLRGQRFYFIIQEASDIPRALEVLQKRLVLAGHGRIIISSSGNCLLRTLVDGSTGQPERLDYAAGAVCHDGLRQERPEPKHVNADRLPVLDTKAALPDLTPAEEAEYQRAVDGLKKAVAAEAEETRDAWAERRIDQEAEHKVQNGDAIFEDIRADLIARGRKQELIALAEGGHRKQTIPADQVLTISDGQTVTAREVLLYPDRYERISACDPVEPDYRGHHRCATLFPSSRTLHSHAHGAQKTYVLGTDEEYAEILADRETPLMADPSATLAKIQQGELTLTSQDAVLFAAATQINHPQIFDALQAMARKQRILKSWRDELAKLVAARRASQDADEAYVPGAGGKEAFDVSDPNAFMERLDEIEKALAAQDAVFTMGRMPVTIGETRSTFGYVTKRDEHGEVVRDETGAAIRSPATLLTARPLTPGTLTRLLHARYDFFKLTADRKQRPAQAPSIMVSSLLATMGAHLSPIAGVVSHPVWDGQAFLSGSGYDPASRLVLNTADAAVPDHHFQNSKEAYRWLMGELLSDFEFESEMDAVIAIAFAISLLSGKAALLQEAGPPLFVVSATRHCSGKTLLVLALALAVIGEVPPTSSFPENREELKKQLDAEVLNSATLLIFDNLRRGWRIGNAQIDEFITSVLHTGRRLGVTETFTGPAAATIVMTGNNLMIEGDTVSRALEINLHPDPDRNAADRKFRHADLLGFVRQNRGRILAALATILAEPAPKDFRVYGRFPRWAQVVAGPLAAASGINLTERLLEAGDAEEEDALDLSSVCAVIQRVAATINSPLHPGWVTAAELAPALESSDWALLGIDPNRTERSVRDLSNALVKNKGLRHGHYQLNAQKMTLGSRTRHKRRYAFLAAADQPRKEPIPDW